jgi:hypothetical protein
MTALLMVLVLGVATIAVIVDVGVLVTALSALGAKG